MRVALFAASRPHYRMAVALARLADAHAAWHSLLMDALAPDVRQGLPAVSAGMTPERLPAPPARPAKATEDAVHACLHREAVDALLVFGGGEAALAAARAARRADVLLVHLEAGQRPVQAALRAGHAALDQQALLRCCLSGRQAAILEEEGIEEGVCVVGDALYDVFQEACGALDPHAAARWDVDPQAFVLAGLDGTLQSAPPEARQTWLRRLSRWGEAAGLEILLLSDVLTGPADRAGEATALAPRLRLLPSLAPHDALSLLCACRCLLTDSDSLQREALYAGKRAIIPHAAFAGQLALPLTSGWHRVASACTAEELSALGEELARPCAHPGLPEGCGLALRRMLAAVMATLADQQDGLL